jgi:AraC-like DNA-binding protein
MIYRRERITPTGSTVAVLVLGSPIVQTPRNGTGQPFMAERGWLAGPHDGPVINAPTAETDAVGIVTSPIGCRALFGVDPAPLRGRVVDLLDVWPPAAALRDELALTDSPTARLDLAEATLQAGLDPNVRDWRRCARAVDALQTDPMRPIAAIADELDITHAHLDREFTRLVGLTPRSLARIQRLRGLLASIDITARVNWTDVAVRWGWFDQSHFIRDFKRHTGVTPSVYLRAARTAAAVGQYGAGFVAEIAAPR